MEIHRALVDGDGRQLDQPVRGDFWSVLFILHSEGQALVWNERNPAPVKQVTST